MFIFLSVLNYEVHSKTDNYHYSQNVFGGTGLIQIPTSRFSSDGEFVFGLSSEIPYNRIFSRVQIFPNIEAVLRYTESTFQPYNSGSEQTWKDKGIDFKYRISEEGKYSPSIALGFNDFGGTGAYSSEFIVASKLINNFDISIGLGWGRLGGVDHINNPLGFISDDKKSRSGFKSLGGRLDTSRLFSGEKTSFFGGIEYLTPINNLSLKAEYDTSDYSYVLNKLLRFNGNKAEYFEVDSRLNFGLSYTLEINQKDKANINLAFVRGNTFLASMAVSTNLNFVSPPKYSSPPETLNIPYLDSYNELDKDWQEYLTSLIMWQFSNVGFITHNLIFNDEELIAELSQGRFKETTSAIDLALRILANNAPKNIKKLTVINLDFGMETLRTSISREKLFNLAKLGPTDIDMIDFEEYGLFSDEAIIVENDYLYPRFHWQISPHLVGTLQHQERFYFWSLEALLKTEYAITKGLYLTTDIGINLSDNYDDYTYHIPDGKLHHVRQDRRLYLTEGKTGMRKMSLDYFFNINSDINAKLSFGYLEWMFGGIGGQILYKPQNKNWALGIDSYWVKQREFNQKFSFREYDTVTGFLSFYYDIPFFDMRLKTSIGKFLGKDKGIDIDISRLFASGARVGGKIALTDCDNECVGEGSFNKWIYFTLPMDSFFIKSSTRNNTGYTWSPLTKDAGTKLGVIDLFDVVVDAEDRIKNKRRRNWSAKKILTGFSMSPKDTLNSFTLWHEYGLN